MITFYNAIYLSPHLDDVVLSCGGQIFQRAQFGENVLIVTVMAGDPPVGNMSDFALTLHDRWQLGSDVTNLRRIEDQVACRHIGADHLHWPIPDCIYRAEPDSNMYLYSSEDDLFDRVHPSEADLIQKISKRITSLPSHKTLYVPLSVGNHVDHQVTRLAVEQVIRRQNLAYYEDYPYTRVTGALDSILQPRSSWRSEIVRLTEIDLTAKIQAITKYESQLSTFFSDERELARQVKDQSERIGGERIWYYQNDIE